MELEVLIRPGSLGSDPASGPVTVSLKKRVQQGTPVRVFEVETSEKGPRRFRVPVAFEPGAQSVEVDVSATDHPWLVTVRLGNRILGRGESIAGRPLEVFIDASNVMLESTPVGSTLSFEFDVAYAKPDHGRRCRALGDGAGH